MSLDSYSSLDILWRRMRVDKHEYIRAEVITANVIARIYQVFEIMWIDYAVVNQRLLGCSPSRRGTRRTARDTSVLRRW